MSTLRTRSITGLIFGIIVIASIWGGKVTTILLFGLVVIFASYELARMLRRNFQDNLMVFTLVGGASPYILSFFYLFKGVELAILIYFQCIVFIIFIILLLLNKGAQVLEKLSPLTALLYLGISFYLFRVVLVPHNFKFELVLSIILLIWSADSFAYLIGTKFGKHKVYPKISPGKSWEGLIGAGVCNLLIAYILYMWLGIYSLPFYLSLSVLVWIIGFFGDLFESFLKRHFNLKDSGTFLPGHGGLLDRFDSFIFVIPFVCLLLLIFSHI